MHFSWSNSCWVSKVQHSTMQYIVEVWNFNPLLLDFFLSRVENFTFKKKIFCWAGLFLFCRVLKLSTDSPLIGGVSLVRVIVVLAWALNGKCSCIRLGSNPVFTVSVDYKVKPHGQFWTQQWRYSVISL